jgi:hypothetical protein
LLFSPAVSTAGNETSESTLKSAISPPCSTRVTHRLDGTAMTGSMSGEQERLILHFNERPSRGGRAGRLLRVVSHLPDLLLALVLAPVDPG